MKRAKIVRSLGVGAGSVLLGASLYLMISTLRVAGGITTVIETPIYLVKLQIVNSSDRDGLEQDAARSLAVYADSALEVRVVDKVRFGPRKLPRSFLISREQDKTAAVLLAEKLGLDPSEIVYKPLEYNYRQVSVTLVLGQDYKSLKLPQPVSKEI